MLSLIKKFFKKNPSINPLWDFIIVGKITSAEKHPNADRLKVCTVDIGGLGLQQSDFSTVPTSRSPKSESRSPIQIVCGGVNVRDGMLVAVARPGVKVHLGGAAEETEITEATIRGVVSGGMLCGPDEIGLLEKFPMKQPKEIADLSALNAPLGSTLTVALKMAKMI